MHIWLKFAEFIGNSANVYRQIQISSEICIALQNRADYPSICCKSGPNGPFLAPNGAKSGKLWLIIMKFAPYRANFVHLYKFSPENLYSYAWLYQGRAPARMLTNHARTHVHARTYSGIYYVDALIKHACAHTCAHAHA